MSEKTCANCFYGVKRNSYQKFHLGEGAYYCHIKCELNDYPRFKEPTDTCKKWEADKDE